MSGHPLPTLMETAKRARAIYARAAKDNPDLWGWSLIDLIADNIPDVSLLDLQTAIVAAGIYPVATPRIQREIARYDRQSVSSEFTPPATRRDTGRTV